MSSWDNNPLYNPENFDPPLRLVAQLDAHEPSFSFDIFLVVQVIETGEVFVADDSGCSCPVPFEDFNSLSDFARVQSWEDVKREYNARFPDSDWRKSANVQSIRNAVVGAFRRGA